MRPRLILFAAITISVPVVATLVVAEYLLRRHASAIALSNDLEEGWMIYHETLGWSMQPNMEVAHRHHDFSVSYRINQDGFRGPPSQEGLPRIAVLGDSFTFGQGVEEGETFVDLLNDFLPEYQFLNFGVPGYSTDQQFLQLRHPVLNYQPFHVIWVVYLGNDLLDNRYPFALQADPGKPYFVLQDGHLQLENVPVPMAKKSGRYAGMSLANAILGETRPYAAWRQYLTRFQLGLRVDALLGIRETMLMDHFFKTLEPDLELFHAMVSTSRLRLEEEGVGMTVVLLPSQAYVRTSRSIAHQYQEYLRQGIMDRLQESGIPVIDAASILSGSGSRHLLYHPNEGHLTAEGNRRVAEIIAASLSLKSSGSSLPGD